MLGIAALALFMHKLQQKHQAFYELYYNQMTSEDDAEPGASEHENPSAAHGHKDHETADMSRAAKKNGCISRMWEA